MTDHFSLLGITAAPWIDQEELKEKFHRLSAAHHPDVAGAVDGKFAALNKAYNTLSDPVTRLRYYIELRFPNVLTRSAAVPEAIAEIFPAANARAENMNAFFARQSKTTSPLGLALLEPERLTLLRDAHEFLSILSDRQQSLLAELKQASPGSAQQLADIYYQLAYMTKWSAQLREGIIKLGGHV
jgi:curved DNA-binding protein CbpA